MGRKNKILRDADLPSTVILPCWWLIISHFEPNRPDTHIPHFLCWWKNLIFGMPFVGFKIPLCCGECEGREFHFSADMLKACIKGWALHPTKAAGCICGCLIPHLWHMLDLPGWRLCVCVCCCLLLKINILLHCGSCLWVSKNEAWRNQKEWDFKWDSNFTVWVLWTKWILDPILQNTSKSH